jgi:alpha-tubulin suppressor-like RCC1 family protein
MKKIHLLFLTTWSIVTFSQTYNYTLYNTQNSGISSSTINHIDIDASGSIWMTTGSSLTKFNGTTFNNFTTNIIPMDGLRKFVIDNLNRKWIATVQSGLVLYDGNNWVNYTPQNSGIPTYNIQDIAIDSANNIWLATYSGLVKFNGTTWTIYNSSNSNIASNSINSVAVKNNNTIYLTGDSILMKFNGATFSILGDQANKIRKVVNNDLYVDFNSGGYLKYSNESVTDAQYYQTSCLLDCGSIGSIEVDQNNKVWIGFFRECQQGGLQNFTDCRSYFPPISGASFSYINTVRMLTSNTIWVGTIESGLVKMTLNTSGSCLLPTNLSVTNVTATTATLNWSAPTPAPNGYAIMYSNSSNQLGGIPVYTQSTSINLQNLVPNSDYHWWIASDCGASQSDWSSSQFFYTPVEPPCFSKISGGLQHTAAIKADGTLWAWGQNNYYQLGDGTTTNRNVPVQIGSSNNWQSVAAAQAHTIALKTDGTLWAWGNNGNGQLGDGTTTNRTTPVQIGNANDWLNIAVGDQHSYAIKTNGTLWGWGLNGTYQLGDGTNINKLVPTQLGTATNWRSVSGGSNSGLGLKTNGTLWSWGANSSGQIGDNTTTWRSLPVQVGTATDWNYIHSKGANCYAIKTGGTLWGWGMNSDGRLGDGTTSNRLVPTQIRTATNWKSVYTSGGNTIGFKTNNTLWVWGSNTLGELGNGNTNFISLPTAVGFEVNWVSAGGGDRFSVLLNSEGKVFTSGWSPQGQLGAGSINQRNTFGQLTCPSSALGTEDFDVSSMVKIYPNPVRDLLNFSFESEISSIKFYNLLGQEVLSKSLKAKEGNLDVSKLASGTYLMRVIINDIVKNLKVVKD